MRQHIGTTRTRDGVRVAYATAGHGPPLVYVPGWLSHLELSWSLPDERAHYEALCEGRTLVRYDRPGCGLSDRPSRDRCTEDDELETLRAVLAAVGVERCDLFGSSLGAALAVAWAARAPASVCRLVLYGGWACGAEVATPEIQAHVLGLVAEHWGLATDLLTDVFAPDAGPGTRSAFSHYQREAATPETACLLLGLAYRIDVRDRLSRVRVPTLVLHRERDRAAPLAQGRVLADGIAGARLEVLPGRSHLPYVGDPTQLCRPTRRFLGLRPRVVGEPRTLTPRQREVAALVAEGCTNREIGQRLGITEKSAETHVERIRQRLDFRSRTQVAAWYVAQEHPN